MNSSSPAQRGGVFGASGGTARLMFYTLLAITLMALDYRGQYVVRIQSLAGQAAEPLFWAVDLPFSGSRKLFRNFAARERLAERVAELELQAMKAGAENGRLADLQFENRQLRDLLGAARPLDLDFVPAELTGIDLDPFAHRVIVKRGRADGIRVGMPVIDDRGVLGQVDQVFQRMSRVILISDPDHALPVQVLPAGERTIAYGSGRLDRLRLTDLPMNARLGPDDLVVTSGLGGRFPSGLPVGRVVSVARESGQPFAAAQVRPLSAMDRNRMVLIVATLQATDAELPDPLEPDGAAPSGLPSPGPADAENGTGEGSAGEQPAEQVAAGGRAADQP